MHDHENKLEYALQKRLINCCRYNSSPCYAKCGTLKTQGGGWWLLLGTAGFVLVLSTIPQRNPTYVLNIQFPSDLLPHPAVSKLGGLYY